VPVFSRFSQTDALVIRVPGYGLEEA
jgi:hypothetical protein